MGEKSVRDNGLFVDHDVAVARGGAGNYASRGAGENAPHPKMSAYEKPISTSAAAPVSTSADMIGSMIRELDGQVLFPSGGAKLSAEASRRLKALGAALRNSVDASLLIAGFSDSVGSTQANQGISEARVRSVKQELIRAGAREEQLRLMSFGEANPRASNETQEGRMQNRRVEISASTASR